MDRKTASLSSLYLDKYMKIIEDFTYNDDNTIPLCAAESTLSDFAKKPLTSGLQERYIRGSARSFDLERNFSGSEFIFPLYQQINEVSSTLFQCKYADPRPLSGMNATISLLMAITDFGDNVLLLPSDAGGHESFPPICKRLGLNVVDIPFDYSTYQMDINALNKMLEHDDYSVIILAPSDILFVPKFNEIIKSDKTKIIYDATQTLGLIAGGVVANPFKQTDGIILTGGTHKTLPGPTSGLILADDESLIEQTDSKVSPIFVRNPQPHQVASLLLSLIEFLEFGKEYMADIQKNANYLGKRLEEKGFHVAKMGNLYTETHQLFLSMSQKNASQLNRNAREFKITLDKKSKAIYGECGIRIGVQTITRYGWDKGHLDLLSELLYELKQENIHPEKIKQLIEKLPGKKRMKYKLDPDIFN